MSKLIGIGKVQNGRMMFATVDGKGFSRPTATPVVRTVPAVEPRPVYVIEELDVPEFMKDRKKKKAEVIHVDFVQKEEELSEPEKMVEELIAAGKWVLRPLKNYFFGKDEE